VLERGEIRFTGTIADLSRDEAIKRSYLAI